MQHEDGTITHEPDVPPPQPPSAARRLYNLVQRKQIQRCRLSPGGCTHERSKCRYSFPFKPNHDGTVFDESANRCARRVLRLLPE